MVTARTSCGLAPLVALLLAGCAAPASRTGAVAYAVPAGIDFTLLLGPPPRQAEALRRDLEGVRAAERERTAEESARAEASSTVDVFQFSEVLGPRFEAGRLPRTKAFFDRVYRSALPHLQATKDCWNRPRPFEVDEGLAPLERSLASTRVRAGASPPQARARRGTNSPCSDPAAPRDYAAAYPSGHATVGAMHAILLAQMIPEHREALFGQGWEHGRGRLIAGVHFPTDIEAGRILGTLLVALMAQDPRFRAEFETARGELREALQLPRPD